MSERKMMVTGLGNGGDGAVAGYLGEVESRVVAGYPRPRLVRDRWVDLTGPWEFAVDDADVGEELGWNSPGAQAFSETIIVPFPFESERSGIGDARLHPVVWYRRVVRVPEHKAGEQVLVHFGAVDYCARVWADGQLLGEHTGGHTPFRVLLPSGVVDAVTLVVRAEDRPAAVDQPRGKQDWREVPHSIWYGRTSGIWQPVWMEVVPTTHLVALDFDTHLADGRIDVRVRLSRPAEGTLVLRVSLGGELVAEQTQLVSGSELRFTMSPAILANAWEWEHLEWSPEHPRLLGTEATLLDGDGERLDTAWSYFGIRSVEAVDGQFLLNRRPCPLRLVLAQGYWPDTRLAAPTRQALRDEVELIKSLGFNGVRMHQKIEDPVFLYWCDRLGALVWEEMPSVGTFSATAMRRLVDEWMEVLQRDAGHPCVVVWVPLNESWGVPALASVEAQQSFARSLAELTRALDPTRLVVSNDGWEHVDSDLLTIHDYAPDGASLLSRYGDAEAMRATLDGPWPSVRALTTGGGTAAGAPVVLSEFGGIALSAVSDDAWHGYSHVPDADAFLDRLVELFAAVHGCRAVAGFCYTQLSDTDQESNGLTWPDRKPKLPAGDIAALVIGDH